MMGRLKATSLCLVPISISIMDALHNRAYFMNSSLMYISYGNIKASTVNINKDKLRSLIQFMRP